MEKTILIDGKEVKLKATAATVLLYRTLLKRDVFKDMMKLQDNLKKAQNKATALDDESYMIIVQMAYVFAKQADKSITSDFVEWLGQFEPMAFMPVLEDVLKVWAENQTQMSEAKKNSVQMTGK